MKKEPNYKKMYEQTLERAQKAEKELGVYKSLGARLFEVGVRTVETTSQIRTTWVVEELTAIFIQFGMPRIAYQWEKK